MSVLLHEDLKAKCFNPQLSKGSTAEQTYFRGNRELIVYDASLISLIKWCPCILTKYSHKLAAEA